ncbi:MAG: hypothetical protein JWM43_2489 [Acidobacteriaceae bacterium]|nr:hypothetical protein [Acidobacteriaceae bacterium]
MRHAVMLSQLRQRVDVIGLLFALAIFSPSPTNFKVMHYHCVASNQATQFSGRDHWHDRLNTLDEGLGIELGAKNLVRAVRQDGDAPVADESHKLPWVGRADLGAEALCGMNSCLTFDVHKYKSIRTVGEKRNDFGMVQRGVYVIA